MPRPSLEGARGNRNGVNLPAKRKKDQWRGVATKKPRPSLLHRLLDDRLQLAPHRPHGVQEPLAGGRGVAGLAGRLEGEVAEVAEQVGRRHAGEAVLDVPAGALFSVS